MPSEIKLGQLEKVDLNKAFPDEPKHFTPWLAEPGNLALLGKALNITLESGSTEESVGDFSADIVCTDASNGDTVLIENQLGATDHTHVGQVLVYAAGLDAVKVVWVAKEFRDEHRDTLDWLNRKTDPSIRLYGLEIELWKIGDSFPAPKFNIVVQPDDRGNAGLTEPQRINLEFWASVNGKLHKVFKPKPSKFQSLSFGALRKYFKLRGSFNKNQLEVALIIDGPNAYDHAKLLEVGMDDINDSIGAEGAWQFKELGGLNKFFLNRAGSVQKSGAVPDSREFRELAGWMASQLELFREVFSDRVQSLQLTDGEPEGGGS